MPVVAKMPTSHFDTVIRMLKRAESDRVKQVRMASFRNLKRLGVKRDVSKAVVKLPTGSDQVDVGSVVTWMDKIKPENKSAIRQLVAMDATSVRRMQA